MKKGWIVIGVSLLLCGCSAQWWSGFKDGWSLSAMKPETYATAKAKIDAMVIGQMMEHEFSAIWYGETSAAIQETYSYVNAGLIIGPKDAPQTFDTSERHSAVHYIIRKEKGDNASTEYLWAVTFVNGKLESIYTY